MNKEYNRENLLIYKNLEQLVYYIENYQHLEIVGP